jgi:photosystem II stability/assembly factor-like uncharacterized protein
MKNLFFILNLLLIFSIGCRKDKKSHESDCDLIRYTDAIEGWNISYYDISIDLTGKSIYFYDESLGFVISYNGEMARSQDSGKTWQMINSNTQLALSSIYFISKDVGFLTGVSGSCISPDCGKGAVFLKTTDGGSTWSKKFFDTVGGFYSLKFYNDSIGLAIMSIKGTNGKTYLVKTSNEGNDWINTGIKIPIFSNKLFYINNTCFAIADQGKIYKTNDIGKTWDTLITGISPNQDIYDISLINENIFFVTNNSKVLKTIDGGKNWIEMNFPVTDFYSLHFSNENEGFTFQGVSTGYEGTEFVGNYVYTTTDGGVTWKKSVLYKKFAFGGIKTYANPDLGYAYYSCHLLQKLTKIK